MPQMLLRSITLHPQIILTKSSANGHGKVTNVIHFNTIGSAVRDEFRHGFVGQPVRNKDDRYGMFHPAQCLQRLRSRRIGDGMRCNDNVIGLCLQAFDKQLGSWGYFRTHVEMCTFERTHTELYIRDISVKKQNAQGLASACKPIQPNQSLSLLDAVSCACEHLEFPRVLGSQFLSLTDSRTFSRYCFPTATLFLITQIRMFTTVHPVFVD